MNLEQARQKLEKYGQLHVLDYYEELTDEQKQELLKQIDETDFSVIRYAENPHGNQVRGKITPLGAMEISEIEKNKEHFTEGIKSILPRQDLKLCASRRSERYFLRAAWVQGSDPTTLNACMISASRSRYTLCSV